MQISARVGLSLSRSNLNIGLNVGERSMFNVQPSGTAWPRSFGRLSFSPSQLLFLDAGVRSCSLFMRALVWRNWSLIHWLSCNRLCLASAV